MRPIKKGSTDQSCVIRIIDSTTGLPETAVEYDTSGIDLWFRREGETKTSITEAALAALDSAHSDGGIEHIGDGYYRLDLPDAAVAAGSGENGVMVGGTITGMIVIGTYIPLVDYDPYDTVRLGLTALPNAAADAAGGLPISDAGGLDMDDLPITSEFEARTLPSADYVVVGDTIAGVTLVATTTDVTNGVTLADDAITASKYDESTAFPLTAVNGSTLTEAGGDGDHLTAVIGTNGDTLETLSDQIDSVGAAAGAALPKEVTVDNATIAIKGISKVGTETGTFANTQAEDGVYHVITHADNDIDWIYGFDIGGGRTAVSVSFYGYLTGSNDAMFLQAYDFVGSDWETIANLPGQAGIINVSLTPDLLSKHTGTGADLGMVYLRFEANDAMSSPVLNVDKLTVNAVNIGQSVGYANGTIWIDTVNGTAGTEPFVNGTADNPVDTLADGLTLATALGLRRFYNASGTSITLTSDSTRLVGLGESWSLALGGQVVTNGITYGATITGDADAASTGVELIDCHFDTAGTGVGMVPGIALRCGFRDEIRLLATGTYVFQNCYSEIAGNATPSLDFGAAIGASYVNFRSYSGGIEIKNMKAGDIMSLEGNGQLILNASCDAGNISIRGNFTVTDNAGGAVTLSDDARYDITQITDSVPTVAEIQTQMESDNSDLDYLVTDLINKKSIKIATGISTQYDDTDGSLGAIGSGYSDDGVDVARPRQVIVK